MVALVDRTLLERIGKLEADNLELRKENAEIAFTENQKNFARMRTQRERIQGLEKQLGERTAEKEQLQADAGRIEEAAQARITGLEEQLQRSDAQLQARVAELDAMRAQQRAQGEEGGENDERIAQLEEELQNSKRAKEAALQISQLFQTKNGELDRVILGLRAEIAEQTLQHDEKLLRLNGPLQRQVRELTRENNRHNGQIADLEGQLERKTAEREELLNQIDELEHQEEVNQNAVGDLQLRLNATNQRIGDLNGKIAQERVKVNKAIELSDLYLRFYQAKGKVRALKDCQISSVVCGRIFLALVGAILGVVGVFIGLLVGGEVGGTAAHVLNASRVRSLEAKRKRLQGRISDVHRLLAIGPIPSEFRNSFWRDFNPMGQCQ